ncbi:hypothetical protein F8M41_026554 [Gigaspora margarita]|uniref:Uncharacterized protein n=1 Tax=Gigaspora margarita TaxID=4874 RepID=A0A8H3XJN9_GIGMA|nr:hypothetical protein F8M41_026554 [Gigaspora margarita]
MLAPDSHHFSFYNSDTISWSNDNENKLDESNELNNLNSSNISENIHDLDTASNSSSPDQALPCNSGITITNSLGKRVRKRKAFSGSKRLKPKENLQDKITNHVLAWIVDNLQQFNATTTLAK